MNTLVSPHWLRTVVAVVSTVAVLVLSFSFLVPSAEAQLITCGTDISSTQSGGNWVYSGECTVCDLQVVAQRLLNWFIVFLVIVAALLFVQAGVLYVSSPSNPGNISRAHKIFRNTFIGIAIILAAWVIIDFVMKSMVGPEGDVLGAGPWNAILCTSNSSLVTIPGATTTDSPTLVSNNDAESMDEVTSWYENLTSRDNLLIALAGLEAIIENNPDLAGELPAIEQLVADVSAINPYDSDAAAQLDAAWEEYIVLQTTILGVTGVVPGESFVLPESDPDAGPDAVADSGVTAAGLLQDILVTQLNDMQTSLGDYEIGSVEFDLSLEIQRLLLEVNAVDTADPGAYDALTALSEEITALSAEVYAAISPTADGGGDTAIPVSEEVQVTLDNITSLAVTLMNLINKYPIDLYEWNDDLLAIMNAVATIDVTSPDTATIVDGYLSQLQTLQSIMLTDLATKINDEPEWLAVLVVAEDLLAQIADVQARFDTVLCPVQYAQLPALIEQVNGWDTYDDPAGALAMLQTVQDIVDIYDASCTTDVAVVPMSTDTILVFSHMDDDILWMYPYIGEATKIIYAAMASNPAYEYLASIMPGGYASKWIATKGYVDTWAEYSSLYLTLPDRNTLINRAVIKEEIRPHVSDPAVKRVITHNEWGEYGHCHHMIINRAVRELAVEYGKDVWVLAMQQNGHDAPAALRYLDVDTNVFEFETKTFDHAGFSSYRQKYYDTVAYFNAIGQTEWAYIWTWYDDGDIVPLEYPSGDRNYIMIVDQGVDLTNAYLRSIDASVSDYGGCASI